MAADTRDTGNNGREATLDIPRHLSYWKRCLRSPLPDAYLSNEGNRLALAYFIINSISILTPPPSSTDQQQQQQQPLIAPDQRRALREWVLSHQHAGGGFCGTSSLVFPLRDYEEWDFDVKTPSLEHSGLANIAATLFGLQLLALLADDDDVFRGVDRARTLQWLKKLQREDGSFGEVLRKLPGQGWFIGGGYDMRYCYIATSIRWFLRGDVKEGQPGWVEDFDTDGLARYILSSQTYDGGFAASSQEEPHAGYAYCALSALSLLSRPFTTNTHPSQSIPSLTSQISSLPITIHWLASRQFVHLSPNSSSSDDEDEDSPNFTLPSSLASLSLLDPTDAHIAFNGRCNKTADTCYYWWVGGALSILGMDSLILNGPSRRFILERMQHVIGGFGKTPGAPPDVYHSCFGLAILALNGEKGLSELDAALAIPVETVRRIEKSRERLVNRAKEEGGKGSLGREMVGMGLGLLCGEGERPKWLA